MDEQFLSPGVAPTHQKHAIATVMPRQVRHMAGTTLAEKGVTADQIHAVLTHEKHESSEKYIDKTLEMRKVGMNALAAEIISLPTSAEFFVEKMYTNLQKMGPEQFKTIFVILDYFATNESILCSKYLRNINKVNKMANDSKEP